MVRILLFVVFLLLVSGCSHYPVKAKVWDVEALKQGDAKTYYPERDDVGLRVSNSEKKDFGIVFSGGGTRAASAALGQIRALKKLGWFRQADYVSLISGGAWGVVPYLYFDPKRFDPQMLERFGYEDAETAFLGRYIEPQDMNYMTLACDDAYTIAEQCSFLDFKTTHRKLCLGIKEEMEKKGVKGCFDLRFSKTVADARVAQRLRYAWSAHQKDESYSYVLGDIFLKPYGLNCVEYKPHEYSEVAGKQVGMDGINHQKCFFTWDEKRRDEIVEHNKKSHPYLNKEGIAVIRDAEGPYPIIGTSLMVNKSGSTFDYYPIEITPDYVGTQGRYEYLRKKFDRVLNRSVYANVPIGGGYIQTIGFDSEYPAGLVWDGSDTVEVELKEVANAFSLADALAATGAAPQSSLHKAGIFKVLTTNLGFPEFQYWHVQKGYDYERHQELEALEYSFGDGGHLDNIGIMPLLARQVQNILVFVNTQTAFKYDEVSLEYDIYDNLISFFDLPGKYSTYRKVFKQYPHNVIFEGNKFEDMIREFARIKKEEPGSPLVFCDNFAVKENSFWNIHNEEKEYKPDICFVYLDRNEEWIGSLTEKSGIKREILELRKPFEHFPHYWTFAENWAFLQRGPIDYVIDYTEPMVNALAGLSGWSVMQAQGKISRQLKIPK